MLRTLSLFILLLACAFTAVPAAAQSTRIKDLGSFQGVRPNQLVGYGIVVGLAGTGDDNLLYLTQAMAGVAGRFGVTLPPGVNPALKNAAAVMITAELPPFAKPGQRVDVTISAIGRARSLRGGTLVLSPLLGADGQIYAMAQGSLAVGGLGVSADDGSQLIVNVPSSGRIAGGATVEREVAQGFATDPMLVFNLTDADLSTATLVAQAINAEFGQAVARATDAVSVAIEAPLGDAVRIALMSRIENIALTPAQAPARVIVNARTGTVVMNGAVRLGPAAVSHGSLSVEIAESPTIVQPQPFSDGVTAEQRDSSISAVEERRPLTMLPPGGSLADVVSALNLLGAGPGDMVAILEALKQAGSLRAELVIL